MAKDNHLMTALSVFGIFLVVLGHSGFEEAIIAQKLGGLHNWIYSFHMPLFFTISGFLFSLTNPDVNSLNAPEFLIKKVKRLLVPYFVLGVIIYAIKVVFSGLSHAVRDFSVGKFFYMFIAPGCDGSTMGYLWYVVTLFVVFSLVTLLVKCNYKIKTGGGIILLVIACILIDYFAPKIELLNLSQVIHYLPYFLLGIGLHVYEHIIKPIICWKFNYLIFFVISVVLTIWHLPVIGVLAYFIRAVIGICMSIAICQKLLEFKPFDIFFVKAGPYTYSIYLLSWFGQYIVKVLVVNILDLHWIVCVIGMFIGGIVFPVIVCMVVDKIPVLNRCKFVRLVIGYNEKSIDSGRWSHPCYGYGRVPEK